VVEFRHRSFGHPERWAQVRELCAVARLTSCCVDEPQVGSRSMPRSGPSPPRSWRWSASTAATTRRGTGGGTRTGDRFDHRYTPDELRGWLAPIRQLGAEAEEVHHLFNDNQQNFAVLDAFELAALLGLPRPRPMPEPTAVLPLPLTADADRPADDAPPRPPPR